MRPEASIQNARVKALKEIKATQGILGLINLAARVKLPLQIAESLPQLELDEEEFSFLVRHLAFEGEAKLLATSVTALAFATFGLSWVKHIERIRCESNLSAEEVARLLNLENVKHSWDIVTSFGTDVDDAYWRQKRAFGFRGTSEEMEYSVSRYLSCGRTLAAIEATHKFLSDVTTSTIIIILEATITEINASTDGASAMITHYVEHLFTELHTRTDISREELARMEFAYLPLLIKRNKPLTLHKMLVESPEFLFLPSVQCSNRLMVKRQ